MQVNSGVYIPNFCALVFSVNDYVPLVFSFLRGPGRTSKGQNKVMITK